MVIALTVQPHSHGWSGWYPQYPWYGTYGQQGGLVNQLLGSQSSANLFQQLQSGFNVTEVPIDAGQQPSST